ncbi:NACHT, LRR and PYD domains-containing protein 5, partial [Sigmodon hispidus]
EKLLICWQDVCSVLISSKHMQVLQVKDTNLDESAFLVLYKHLKHPSCVPQVLEVNNVSFLCDNHLFFEMLSQNYNLQHLNLSLTFLSRSDVKLLCDVLNQAECKIEKLLVAGCQLSPDDCKIFASILISSKTLKHLNIASNNLDKGMYSLCKALCHPDCVLKHLVLANCFLSEQCWDYLSDVLRRNRTLSHLDVSSNDLKDEGLKVLCKALSLPDSVLKSLCLRYCLITASGCQDLAEVLRSNQNLRSLQVSNNKIEDAGVKFLCDALKQPICHLENLGLEDCELTDQECMSSKVEKAQEGENHDLKPFKDLLKQFLKNNDDHTTTCPLMRFGMPRERCTDRKNTVKRSLAFCAARSPLMRLCLALNLYSKDTPGDEQTLQKSTKDRTRNPSVPTVIQYPMGGTGADPQLTFLYICRIDKDRFQRNIEQYQYKGSSMNKEALQAKKEDTEAHEQDGSIHMTSDMDVEAEGEFDNACDVQGYKSCVITKFDTCMNVRYDNPEMQVLFEAFNPYKKIFWPHTVILHGRPGIGKSALARSIILGWAKGKLYQDISYAFFFSVREIKWTEKSSLSQLISRQWPDSQAPMTEIMSKPERLLFVIDGFDDLESAFLHYNMRPSVDWEDEQPIYILIYSLLIKALLPQSFLIITTRDTSLETLKSMVVSPFYILMEGLSATRRAQLVLENISDRRRNQVVHSVIDNHQLFDQCEVPSICSLVCEALQLQENLQERFTSDFKTLTSLYATLVFHQLTPRGPQSCLSQKGQVALMGLCRMAVEGVWNMRSVFYDHDLQTHNLKESEISALFHMNILLRVDHSAEHYYIFFHRSLQDFCAALYYILEKSPGKWNQSSITKDLNSIMNLVKRTDFNTHLLGMKCFLFGLVNKDTMAMLGLLLGHSVFPAVKQKLRHWVFVLGQQISATSPADVLNVFHFLFESQDEEFVCSALKSFQEVWLLVNQNMDLMVSSYCLQHCQNLRTLRVDVRDIFLVDKNTKQCPALPQQTHCKPLIIKWWENFCSVLSTHKNLMQLDLGSSVLNEWAMKILCFKLRNSACKVQNLTFKNAEVAPGLQYLWMVLISNQNLRYLNLGNTLLRDDDVKLACEALRHPNCSLETLRLDSCELTLDCYTMVSKLLLFPTSLNSLSLAKNKVGEKSMRLLCDALSDPKCTLKKLILDSCELTPVSCQLLASALLSNLALTHLCLSNNSLRAEEVRQLCQFMRHPECSLQQLVLNQCDLKGDAYGFLALMLITSRKLTHLSLTMNPVEESGMKLLCEAIKAPTCHLQELELVDCQLTGDCCKDLACVITVSKHLKSLDLGHNALGDNGVIALCNGLKRSDCSLRRLGLEACGLTSNCCEPLSLALCCNQHLTSINLIKNDFSTSGMLKLCSAFLHPTSNLWIIGLWKQQYYAPVRRQLEELQFLKPYVIIDGDWYSYDEDDRNWWKN